MIDIVSCSVLFIILSTPAFIIQNLHLYLKTGYFHLGGNIDKELLVIIFNDTKKQAVYLHLLRKNDNLISTEVTYMKQIKNINIETLENNLIYPIYEDQLIDPQLNKVLDYNLDKLVNKKFKELTVIHTLGKYKLKQLHLLV